MPHTMHTCCMGPCEHSLGTYALPYSEPLGWKEDWEMMWRYDSSGRDLLAGEGARSSGMSDSLQI